jgi:hypothetical protein
MLLRPNGYMSVTDADGKIIEADTLQCVHCGAHWVVKPGSGNVRGYCTRCNGPVCGPRCAECVPLERRLEMLEDGVYRQPNL